MRQLSITVRAALIAIAAFSTVESGIAQTAEEFYKNRQISLVVSSGAGTGYDVYSRTFARFLSHHIPGEPHILVQNMPGADGLTAINYIANVAQHDGSVISDTYSTMPFYMIIDGRNAKFDPRGLNWLGSASKALAVCLAWQSSSFKTLDDVMSRSMRVASTGAVGWRAILPRLYNITAGSKFDVITGYGPNEDFQAVENGEVDGSCTFYDTLLASRNAWITQKKANFLVQFGDKAAPELPNVPLALDRIKNADDREAMELILAQQQTGHPYVAPPGVPADRVETLRSAFQATMKDPEFLAAAQQANLWLEDPMSGQEIRKLIEKAYATPPAIVARAKSLLEKAIKR
jgi:tripartite-type tricarboxylate transporter receptor subunit TctC